MNKIKIAKKIKILIYTAGILQVSNVLSPIQVFADEEENGGFGSLNHPLPNLRGTETGEGLESLINNLITFATYIAGIALLGYLVYGGISWIVAGGNEDQVEKAQKTVSNAVIGIVIVVAAIMITQILGTVLGFDNILQPTFPGVESPPPPAT